MRTNVVLCAALALAFAVACTGSDTGGLVIDAAADLGPGSDVVPDVWQPECDPEAEPSGCAEGAICWFQRCVPVESPVLEGPEDGLVAAVASLAPDDSVGAIATTRHDLRRDELGVLAEREDAVGVLLFDKLAFGDYEEILSWTVDRERERPAPVVHLVRGSDGAPVVVSGPRTLRAHTWNGTSWTESEALDTGARQYGSEGTFAPVVDAEGVLHVAYRDVQREVFEVATLLADGSWSVASVREGLDGWGSQVVGALSQGRAVFAHIYSEEDSPTVVRWALVVEQSDEGWVTSEPSLGEGLAIRGRIMGFDAAADGEGRFSLAWVSSSRRFGLAVRRDDGTWETDDSHLSDRSLWDGLNGNLCLRWWQSSAVVTWLGYSEWSCDCFDLRMAMRLDGGWQEAQLEAFDGMSTGGVALDIDGRGRVVVSVGGGVEVDRGIEAPRVFTMTLPDWRASP